MNIGLCKFYREKSGSALVEFSLVLPLLVVVMAFIGDFSRAIYQYHVAEKGVKAAARYLARVPNVTVCAASSFDAFSGKAKALAQRGSFNVADDLVLSNWANASEVTVSVACQANAPDAVTNVKPFHGPDQIPIITVSASFTFNDAGFLNVIKILNPSYQDRGTITIAAAHEEVYVGD